MENELKPCPFCGGTAHHEHYKHLWHIQCNDCNALGSGVYTLDGAAKRWNMRHYDDAPAYVRKLEALRGELKVALYGGDNE